MPGTLATAAKQPERPPPAPRPQGALLRTVWAAVVTALLGLLFAGMTIMTVALWASDPGYSQTNPVVDLGFFALGIMIAAGFASQIRGRQVAGLQQAILALLALTVAGLLGGRVEPFFGALALLVAAAPLVILHPWRRRVLAAGLGVSRLLAALSVIAVIPALGYAASMLDRARAAGPSCFLGQCVQGDRFAESAALSLAVVLVALLASARTLGWLLPAWSAGLGAIALVTASLAFPGEVGGLTTPWGVAVGLWGIAFIAIAHAQARQAPPARSHPIYSTAGSPDENPDT